MGLKKHAFLKWNNHKAKRYGRRLPIVQTTADAIQQWIGVRSQINAPVRSDSYLFPAVAERAGEPHMHTSAGFPRARVTHGHARRCCADYIANHVPFRHKLAAADYGAVTVARRMAKRAHRIAT